MKTIIAMIVVLLFLMGMNKRENFQGMSYIKRHKYLMCCNYLGCGHPRCQRFLAKHSSPLVLLGVAYRKGSRRAHRIYGRMDMDSRQHHYFIRTYNRYGDYFLTKIAELL